MGIFSSIIDKIFHHPAAQDAAPAPVQTVPNDALPPPETPDAVIPAQVDVGAVLSQLADARGGGGNYETSIVDLLKLLDLDSSLDARKQLADELNVHVAGDGTTEQNMALHQAVVDGLAANGGKVPDSMHH